MINSDQQIINYYFEWDGAAIDGEIMVPSEMLKLTSNTRVKVLRKVAEYFSPMNKLVTFENQAIQCGAPRQYSKSNPIPVSVQIDGDSPLTVFIHDAGEKILVI